MGKLKLASWVVNPPMATRLSASEAAVADRLARDGWSVRILAYHYEGDRYLLAKKGYLLRSYRMVSIDDLSAGVDVAPILATEERRFPPSRRRRPVVKVFSNQVPAGPRKKLLLEPVKTIA